VDALLPAFLAALFAEIGDKTQILAMLLGAKFRRPGPVLAGIAAAALANSLIAATGGRIVADLTNFRAISLMVALAFIAAGLTALLRQRPPVLHSYKLGIFATSALAFFILEFGDKTQFLTLTLAARADSLLLAACGATAGIVLAAAPAVVLGPGFEKMAPLRRLRIGIGLLFLLIGAVTAIGALRLI
jgi:Ca2+/H+ antiporter, TMEM165/GDT1 family